MNSGITDSDLQALSIDWEHLHLIADGNREFEQELLHIFLTDARQHLSAARVAIAAQSASELEREAHHIKGSSANVGIKAIQGKADILEKQARQQNFEGTMDLVLDIEKYLDCLQVVLDTQY